MSDSGALQADAIDRSPPQGLGRRLRRLMFFASMPGLTVLNAGVGLLLPALLGPAAFGQYALIVTLFQYGLVFDLGLSQLIDKRVPVMLAVHDSAALSQFIGAVLWLRIYIAAALMAGGSAVLISLAAADLLSFPLLPAILSLAAGGIFMIALGPAAIYRARSEHRIFGSISIAINVILAVYRPLGILVGGVPGVFVLGFVCFSALAAVVLWRMPPKAAQRPDLAISLSLVASGLPLFLAGLIWAVYMTANRWVVATHFPEVVIGQFAFGSNIIYLIVGAVGGMSQFYYPKVINRVSVAPQGALSRKVLRDFCLLTGGVALCTAFGLLAGPFAIALLYPKFLVSIPVVILLLLALPSLVVAVWIMPIALSLATRPWLDSLLIYPVALLGLIGATEAGHRLSGTIEGAAHGLVLSSLSLVGLQLWRLQNSRLLSLCDSFLLAGVVMLATLLLFGEWDLIHVYTAGITPSGIAKIVHFRW